MSMKSCLSISLCILLISACAQGENDVKKNKRDEIIREKIEKAKLTYKFSEWAGKTKVPHRKTEKLRFDANDLTQFSTAVHVSTRKENLGSNFDASISDISTNQKIFITIYKTEDSYAAHEAMLCGMAMSTAVPPVYRSIAANDANSPLNVGDIRFIPISEEIEPSYILFARNNVVVKLATSRDQNRKHPSLIPLAKFIDQKLEKGAVSTKQD